MNVKYMDETVYSGGGGKVTLNGTETSSPSFYAPLAAGEKGQILVSEGTGAPSWKPTVALPAGVIMPFAGITTPDGWLICDGSEISRTDYADLFASIGTIYGDGNKVSTFNLPNLVGRYIGGATTSNIGSYSPATSKVDNHTLTISEIPSHNHGLRWTNEGASGSGKGTLMRNFDYDTPYAYATTAQGGSQGHNHTISELHPNTVYMNYMIKY